MKVEKTSSSSSLKTYKQTSFKANNVYRGTGMPKGAFGVHYKQSPIKAFFRYLKNKFTSNYKA